MRGVYNMTDLEQLVKAADNLCNTLEKASQEDRRFNDGICEILERYSWDCYKMKNHLNEIKEYIGV